MIKRFLNQLDRVSKQPAKQWHTARIWLGEGSEVKCANITQVYKGKVLHTDELQNDARIARLGKFKLSYIDKVFADAAREAAYIIAKKQRSLELSQRNTREGKF